MKYRAPHGCTSLKFNVVHVYTFASSWDRYIQIHPDVGPGLHGQKPRMSEENAAGNPGCSGWVKFSLLFCQIHSCYVCQCKRVMWKKRLRKRTQKLFRKTAKQLPSTQLLGCSQLSITNSAEATVLFPYPLWLNLSVLMATLSILYWWFHWHHCFKPGGRPWLNVGWNTAQVLVWTSTSCYRFWFAGNQPVTMADKSNLHYTNAVLHEAMRIKPVAPNGVPRKTTTDCVVGKKRLLLLLLCCLQPCTRI